MKFIDPANVIAPDKECFDCGAEWVNNVMIHRGDCAYVAALERIEAAREAS